MPGNFKAKRVETMNRTEIEAGFRRGELEIRVRVGESVLSGLSRDDLADLEDAVGDMLDSLDADPMS